MDENKMRPEIKAGVKIIQIINAPEIAAGCILGLGSDSKVYEMKYDYNLGWLEVTRVEK